MKRRTQPTPLPFEFEPNMYTVICGREKEHREFAGNRRLRVLVESRLAEYSTAKFRSHKTRIVSQVVDTIRNAGGKFARHNDSGHDGDFVDEDCGIAAAQAGGANGRWYELDASAAREKVGALFRDCLADQYRSSSKNKAAMRRINRRKKAPSSSSPATFSERSPTVVSPVPPYPLHSLKEDAAVPSPTTTAPLELAVSAWGSSPLSGMVVSDGEASLRSGGSGNDELGGGSSHSSITVGTSGSTSTTGGTAWCSVCNAPADDVMNMSSTDFFVNTESGDLTLISGPIDPVDIFNDDGDADNMELW